jgi:hypothetical protein
LKLKNYSYHKDLDHIREREGKRWKLRVYVWLMYSLYKNKYRIFTCVEDTISRRRKKLRAEKTMSLIVHTYMKMSQE